MSQPPHIVTGSSIVPEIVITDELTSTIEGQNFGQQSSVGLQPVPQTMPVPQQVPVQYPQPTLGQGPGQGPQLSPIEPPTPKSVVSQTRRSSRAGVPGAGFTNSFRKRHGHGNIKVPIAAFPQSAQVLLEKYDVDGDATLDVEEILEGFHALEREQNKVQWLLRSLCAFTILSIVLLGAIGGLVYGVIDASKDTAVTSSVLTVKDQPDVPIQTASTEFYVQDNTLTTRASDTCEGSACQANTLAVATAASKASLSSTLPDEDLHELKSMTIASGNAWLHFQVLAVARYEETFSRWGTVVVIYTHIGEITLDDVSVSFHESLEGAFTRAGFVVDKSGRRLLSIATILGAFNKINYLAGGQEDGPAPIPTTFEAQVTTIMECWPTLDCQVDATGALVSWADSPSQNPDYPTVTWTGTLQARNFQGLRSAMEVHVSPSFPQQQLVRVYNATHRFEAQHFGPNDYHCAIEQSGWMEQTKSITNAAAATDATLTFVDNREVNGRACRHWLVQETGQVDVEFDEEIATGQIYMISYLFFHWRFDTLTALPATEALPVPAELDIYARSQACPSNLVPPTPQMNLENWENPVAVDPSWGTPARRSLPPSQPHRMVDRSKTVLGVLDRVYSAGFARRR